MTDVDAHELFIGHLSDADGPLTIDPADLTTHGVIVGMTGSGKTGLGIDLLEDALLRGIPCLVIDPKGDMGNLLLTFPELRPEDFRPWVEEAAAAREGITSDELAARTAQTWRDGLARSGIQPERISRLRAAAGFTIYTPGSSAGVPLNLIGSLQAPASADDVEVLRDEVEGLASGLLGLVGIEADPLASPEHILIANLVERSWSAGQDLDLATLLGQIQAPPMRKLGVLDLDTFYPPKDRAALALKLNGLLASPSFAAWNQGPPLDIEAMLRGPDGRAQAAIVSVSHLSDAERMFAITLVLSKLVTWTRRQSGTGELRALVYMDEVVGYVPPTAAPPAKKPILTVLKQARAHGVGMVLSTQNPVDLDYKAISNAGTWMIGRLQTERDKGRLLEGMTSAAGAVDRGAIDAAISALDKRQFLLHTTRADAPVRFSTRWAMSYLAGPLTRDQIRTLTGDQPGGGPSAVPSSPSPGEPAAATEPVASGTAAAGTTAAPGTTTPPGTASPAAAGTTAPAAAATGTTGEPATTAASAPALADDETPVVPTVAVEAFYLDPAAAWAAEVGAVPGGTRLAPALVARVRMLFDDNAADLRESVEWEAVLPLGDGVLDWAEAVVVDYDSRDLRRDPPAGAAYVMTDAPIDSTTWFRSANADLRTHLHRSQAVTLQANRELKLFSRLDESAADFGARCQSRANEAKDEEVAELRKRLTARADKLRAAIARHEDRIEEMEADVRNRRNQDLISIGSSVLGSILSGRASTSTIARSAGRAATRGQSSEQRIRTIENRIAETNLELVDLEEDLREAVAEIEQEWNEKAVAIEPLAISLEKSDITVEELCLVWLPEG